MKKISVIVFCHNVGPYIDRCMTSITTQTIGMDRLEIICVDDASSDDTWTHLQRWEQLFPEDVLLIPLETEGGQEIITYRENGDRKESLEGQRLRIVQFYSGTESFNFFTDRLTEELQKRGHEVFICDLEDTACSTEHSYDHLNRFLSKKVDVVICFDGIGTREEQFIRQWDKHGAVVLDILMDPPFRFHPTLEKHPKAYTLFCCDEEHVDYVKKYFPKEVSTVAFMPHVGAVVKKEGPIVPYKERRYDILFSAIDHRESRSCYITAIWPFCIPRDAEDAFEPFRVCGLGDPYVS